MKTRPLNLSAIYNEETDKVEELTQDHHDLIHALEEENLNEVKRILNTGVNPNFFILEDHLELISPLTISVGALNLHLTQTLLEHKADPNIKHVDKEYNVYLMLPEEDKNNCNESNEKDIFFYRYADKIFFKMNGKHELDIHTLLPLLEEEKFDQPKRDPKKCENKKLCDAILEMTANKGHTRFNRPMVEVLMFGISSRP